MDLYFVHLKVWNSLGTYGFLCKNQIKNDEIVRYKAQLIAQGFSQNLILICEKTYSLVFEATTLQYLLICETYSLVLDATTL